MAREPTIVVLGAGINGAVLARELVLSGAHVVVVEAADVAAGLIGAGDVGPLAEACAAPLEGPFGRQLHEGIR